jgi:hypothetical protein
MEIAMSDTPNTPDDDGRDERHKAAWSARRRWSTRRSPPQTERGVIVITTGNGKGKSSSGFGMVVRAMGTACAPAWSSSSRARSRAARKCSCGAFRINASST